MKLNRKIIIPAATLLVGVALAGSATSTIAWYQYSTRTNVSYIGTSAGTSGNLQIKIRGAAGELGKWKTTLSIADVNSYLGNKEIVPVTPGKLAKNDPLKKTENSQIVNKDFYSNPNVGYGPYSKWFKAEAKNYIVLPLQLRFLNIENNKDVNLAKDVYLSKFVIQADSANQTSGALDISEAIRVHFSAYEEDDAQDLTKYTNHLVSKKGGTTVTGGKLALGGTGDYDKGYGENDEWGFNGTEYSYITYGDDGAQVAYGLYDTKQENQNYYDDEYAEAKTEDVDPILVKSVDNSLKLDANNITADKKIGTTVAVPADAEAEKLLNVDVTIWVEGWHKFQRSVTKPGSNSATNEYTSLWDSKLIGSKFDIGFQFAVAE